MRRFRDLPFKHKLLGLTLTSSALALVLGVLGVIVMDVWQFQQDMPKELKAIARAMTDNGQAQRIFSDVGNARETLHTSLTANPRIARAALYRADGRLIADYTRTGEAATPLPNLWQAGHAIDSDYLSLFEPIWEGQSVAGTVYLQAYRDDITRELREHGPVILVVMLVVLGLFYALTSLVARSITRPLEGLSQTAQSVLAQSDYFFGVPESPDDELGPLTDVVNHLLERIQARKNELNSAREELEARVEARTRDLSQSEARTRALTDSAQDAIVMMDPEGRISYWNPAAERILGYTSAEAIGQDLHQLIVPAQYRPLHEAAYPKFLQTGQGGAIGKSLDLAAIRKDGVEVPVQLSLSAVSLEGAWHAVGILRDITESKRAAAMQEETNQQLEIATARAYEMTVKAEEASAAKSSFLANMSHEIRTPMNGVIGMTSLLLDTKLDDEQRRYAEIVRSSAEFLLALINDILDFSKIESGKLELECIDFDLRELLDDFTGMFELRAKEKNIGFVCAVPPEVPHLLRGDPGRLRQILFNLAGNALKFTSVGEVSVRPSLLRESERDVVLRIGVRDTGIGIPVQKQGLLFSKFSQVDASTTRKFGGTGLGLSICRQLVVMMDGEIGVNSEEGRGSEFWFTLRLGKQPPGQVAKPTRSERIAIVATPALDAQRLAKVRILLAEDNITNQQVALAMLGKIGLKADAVASGVEAVAALRSTHYDLVLMDVQMPEMDGFEATRLVRDGSGGALNREIPIIAMTAHAMQGDKEKCLAAGMDDYLSKPVAPAALSNLMQKWLAKIDEPGKAADAPLPVDLSTRPRQPSDQSSTPPRPAQRGEGWGEGPSLAAPLIQAPADRGEGAPELSGKSAPSVSPDPGTNGAAVFDEPTMLERLMDDRDLAREIARCFLADIPTRIEALQSLVNAADATGAGHQAHTIKGASANVGGDALAKHALTLERAGKAGDLETLRAGIPELSSQFARLKKAMEGSSLFVTTTRGG